MTITRNKKYNSAVRANKIGTWGPLRKISGNDIKSNNL